MSVLHSEIVRFFSSRMKTNVPHSRPCVRIWCYVGSTQASTLLRLFETCKCYRILKHRSHDTLSFTRWVTNTVKGWLNARGETISDTRQFILQHIFLVVSHATLHGRKLIKKSWMSWFTIWLLRGKPPMSRTLYVVFDGDMLQINEAPSRL